MYKYMLGYAVRSMRIVRWSRRRVRCRIGQKKRRKRSKKKRKRDTQLRSLRRRVVIIVLIVKAVTNIRRSKLALRRKNL